MSNAKEELQSEIGNGVVTYDTWEEMRKSWLDRASVLQDGLLFSICCFLTR